jgi:hypothetical protein
MGLNVRGEEGRRLERFGGLSESTRAGLSARLCASHLPREVGQHLLEAVGVEG